MEFYIIISLVIIIVLYIFITYNKLVKYKNLVSEAFSTMDVYLKKRWDLVPNLVNVVKNFASHEKEIFEKITKLRTNNYQNMTTNKKIDVNKQLDEDISKIIIIVENYPELRANETFLQLNNELSKIEDEIANSRKYYNGTVRVLNNTIHMFPNNIVAKLFGFQKADMFQANIEEKKIM